MAKILKVRDENGLGIDYTQFEEVVQPVYMDIPRKLKTLKEFKYKNGDVFVCTYPKSGTHWMTAMLHLLAHAKSHDDIMTGPIPLIPFIDMFSTQKIAAQPQPRIIASHLQYHRLPVEHMQNGGKIILLLRNPKDAAVSLFYHLKGQDEFRNKQSWDHFLKSFVRGQVLFGSYIDYANTWSKVITDKVHTNILLVYYEDLVQDCFSELTRIQNFLETDRDEETLRLIAHRCSYGNLKQTISSGKMPVVVRDVAGDSILLRKGKVGDWKNHFTDEQNDVFDKVCHEKLRHTVFNFRYENDIPQPKL